MREEDLDCWIFRRGELQIGGDTIVPDISSWRRSRMPQIPNVEAFNLAPDWICDVVTPETGLLVRRDKLTAYARYGVGSAWIVNASLRTLEVYQLIEKRWSLLGTYGGDDTVRMEPFEAIEFPLASFWMPGPPAA